MLKGASLKNKAIHKKKRCKILFFILLPVLFSSITLNVKDFGAKGNGITDDTAAFQKCIDALISKGGGTMTVPLGKYPITFLKFFGKEYSNITINGDNAHILQRISGNRKAAENNRFQTFAQRHAADGCFVFDAQVSRQIDDTHSIKNIKISGLNFISDVERYGFDELLHQISAHGVSNFIVENCTFTGFLGDGIAINGGTDFSKFHDAYNKDVIIRNCRFDGVNKNNRQGISIYYSDGFTIDRCSFRNTTRDDMPGAIDIEPDRGMNVVRNGV
ncbi:MAG: glycoside hydrolase family 55 protein, partial [Weeksellaceae bacterium]|nr:glycoside hydrolase family 55 protein [Weeksellaceae bacterium]